MHTLIIGRTESGKTTLAKAITRQYTKTGNKPLVLDPMQSAGWGEGDKLEYVQSVEELIQKAMKTQGRLLVIDEGTIALDKYDKNQVWITKSSRHAGHSALIIGHNLTDIAKQIRTQCTQIFVLGCSRTDARDLIDEYDQPILAKCTKLDTFHFAQILVKKNVVNFGVVNPNDFSIAIQKNSEKIEKSLDTPDDVD